MDEYFKKVEKKYSLDICEQRNRTKNLKQEAKKRGIDHRIIFAEKVSISDHLKRMKLADIFLDTFPYNAHTSASDSVRWVCL